MKYATTIGEYSTAGRYIGEDEPRDARADDPSEPEGDGWKLIGTAASDGLLFWTWQKDD